MCFVLKISTILDSQQNDFTTPFCNEMYFCTFIETLQSLLTERSAGFSMLCSLLKTKIWFIYLNEGSCYWGQSIKLNQLQLNKPREND